MTDVFMIKCYLWMILFRYVFVLFLLRGMLAYSVWNGNRESVFLFIERIDRDKSYVKVMELKKISFSVFNMSMNRLRAPIVIWYI